MKKKNFKKYIIFGIYAIAIFSSVFLSVVFTFKNISDNVISTVSYYTQGSVDYKVYYKDNDYYNEPFYDKKSNQKFAGNLIDNIEINYDYNLTYSDIVSGDLNYYVEAVLTVEDNLNKSYIIDNKTTDKYQGSNKNLKKSITIDYNYYKDLYNKYVNTMGESYAGNAYLNIYLRVENVVDYSNLDEIKKNNYIELIIPISDDPITFGEETDITNLESTISLKSNNSFLGVFYKFASIAMWIITVLLIISVALFYNKEIESSSTYKRKLAKILRDYDDIIVNVRRLPHMSSYEVIEVTTFRELLDAQTSVEMPINFKEEKEFAKFVVIKDNLAWVYTLKKDKKA